MMRLFDKLKNLAAETNTPCVTISLNTHRTHPDSLKDEIVLKNLLMEAEKRVIEMYGKRPVASLLDKLNKITGLIDVNYNLDSLHLFLSNDTAEVIRLAWPTIGDRVQIADTFDLRTVIKAYNRTEEYLILLLSQGGVKLYRAMNNCILSEIENEDFDTPDVPENLANYDNMTNPRVMRSQVADYFNRVDKAVLKVAREMDMKCVVISTEDNLGRLFQVANKPDIYIGHASLDYKNAKEHEIAAQAWKIVQKYQHLIRKEAIDEMKEAVGDNKVLTALDEIYDAAVNGAGDMLIVREDFTLPGKITGDNVLHVADDPQATGVTEDITSDIAWEVLSKNGRVFFTSQDDIRELGDIVLKTRY